VNNSEPLHALGQPPLDDASRLCSIGIDCRTASNRLFGVVVDLNGAVVPLPARTASLGVGGRAVRTRELHSTDPEAVVSGITELVAELRALRPDLDDQFFGVGVSVGGHVNGRTGEVILSPQLSWRTPVPLAERLKSTTRFETVVVENDVNALAVGAQFFGDAADARGPEDAPGTPFFAVVRLETGIGVGLVSRGELFRGITGIAGELGHFPVERAGRRCVCGKHGCLETIAGGIAILHAIHDAGREDIESIKDAADLARNGDEVARAAFEQAGEALGRGLAGLVNLLNLRLIILCGEPAILAYEPYVTEARKSFEERAFSTAARDCTLRIERRTGELAARGAASMVFEHLRNHHLE
jgi:predicted NBD/HSP70 family sugar kinase